MILEIDSREVRRDFYEPSNTHQGGRSRYQHEDPSVGMYENRS